MQRQKMPTTVQIGIGLVGLGVVIKIALVLAAFISPLAYLAIIAGIILIIVGLVVPGKKY